MLGTISRRLLGGGAAAGVLAALAVGAAAPAQALPPSLTVATSPAGVSPPSATAVATCPAGSTLIGTGGNLINGGGIVVMTDLIPNIAAGTVTANGVEKVAYGPNWQVQAYAVCDTQLTGVVRVQVVSANSGASPKTVTPACPAGTMLSGLGYQLTGAGGQVFPDDVTPNPTLNGSLLTAYANGGFAANWQLTGYAICANVPAGSAPFRQASAGPTNMVSPKSQTAACSPNTSLTGTGGELTGALGDVILDQLQPNATLRNATARGQRFANPSWNVTSYAICW